jgi:hemolysin III
MVGGGIALLAVPLLVVQADGARAVTSAAIYGASLVVVYTMSVLFHSIHHAGASAWLFRLDQSSIYLLIAGTYTPLAIVLLGGPLGWTLFGIEWGAALLGVITLLVLHRTPPWVHQAAYIALGWAAVLALPSLDGLPLAALALVFGGGIAYTGGAALYWRNRTHTWGVGDHGLWHLLVLAGSLAHLVFVLLYVL